VQGAFSSGGAQVGNSGAINHHWELSNSTTYTHGTHTLKWGGRLRQNFLDDTSVNNFGGTFTFFGGVGPALNANNQPVVDPAICISSTANNLPAGCETYGAGAVPAHALPAPSFRPAVAFTAAARSQFSLSAGAHCRAQPVRHRTSPARLAAAQPDADYGLRYETQTNIRSGRFRAASFDCLGPQRSAGNPQDRAAGGVQVFYDQRPAP
jgi:hypothetical protein